MVITEAAEAHAKKKETPAEGDLVKGLLLDTGWLCFSLEVFL